MVVDNMKDAILQMTKNTEWVLTEQQDNIKLIQFFNGNRKINVYWGPMTIVVHNSEKNTSIIKRNVSLEELKIMMNLRTNFVQKFGEFMRGLGK